MNILSLCLIATTIFATNETEWSSYKKDTLVHQSEAGGWCSLEKAEKMMDLIHNTRPDTCVEIGVFAGSSIYPTAQALKYLNHGKVYAIDPWSKEACLTGYDVNDPNYIWWNNLNLEDIYTDFLSLVKKHELNSFCEPMKMTSQQAVALFSDESIDILHIDGNHTTDMALSDAELWLPKVKSGGYIWFDDVNWATTAKAVSYMYEHCTVDLSRSIGNECLLFKKNK